MTLINTVCSCYRRSDSSSSCTTAVVVVVFIVVAVVVVVVAEVENLKCYRASHGQVLTKAALCRANEERQP